MRNDYRILSGDNPKMEERNRFMGHNTTCYISVVKGIWLATRSAIVIHFNKKMVPTPT